MRKILRSRILVIDFCDAPGAEEVGGLPCDLKSQLACVLAAVLVAVLVGVQLRVACEAACGSDDGVRTFSLCDGCWRKPSSYSSRRMRLKMVLMSLLSPLELSITRFRFLPAMVEALKGSLDVMPDTQSRGCLMVKMSRECDGCLASGQEWGLCGSIWWEGEIMRGAFLSSIRPLGLIITCRDEQRK